MAEGPSRTSRRRSRDDLEIDPSRLRYLLAVARAGGVVAAAGDLGVTSSAVSQQLAKLEQETGRHLLQRTSKGVRLTADGLTLAEVGEEVERVLSEGWGRLAVTDSDPTGTVRIAAFESILQAVLIPALGTWHQRYPGLDIVLAESNPDTVTQGLRTGAFDIVILDRDAEDADGRLPAGVVEVPLMDEPWKLLVPAGAVIGDGPVDLAALGLPWLSVDGSTAGTRAAARVHRAWGRTASAKHVYTSTQTALALVAAGEGVTLMPELALRSAQTTGVAEIELPGLGTRRIALRRHERRGRARGAAEVMADEIRETVAAFIVENQTSEGESPTESSTRITARPDAKAASSR